MVRKKQEFPVDEVQNSANSRQSDNNEKKGYKLPTKADEKGSQLPIKAVEKVRSSFQKRSKHLLNEEFDDLIVNLDESDEELDNKLTDLLNEQSSSQSISREKQRKKTESWRKRKRDLPEPELYAFKEKERKNIENWRKRKIGTDLEEYRQNEQKRIELWRQSNKSKFYQAANDPKKAKFFALSPFETMCKNCNALHFKEEKNNREEGIFYSCCKNGRLSLLIDRVQEYPTQLKNLFFTENNYHKNFIENIRRINSAFSFASISCLRFSFKTPGPPCFKIQGQIYHKFNQSVMPSDDKLPTNGQLYFIDTSDATDLRCIDINIDRNLLESIELFMRENNAYAKSFLLMRDVYDEQTKIAKKEGKEIPELRLLFSLKENLDKRRYNLPHTNEVCAVMFCDSNDDIPPARIVVYPKTEKRLTDLYPLDKCVEPMTYPLLYPCGQEGYHFGLKDQIGKKITICDYYKFVLFFRENGKFFPHFYAKKLFQQWLVDSAAKIEWDRLQYIKTHQTELCSSNYSNVEDFLRNKAEKVGAEIQKRVILPSTFTGGPRNMHEHFMDAMAIVNETGKPDLFVTFTCNPNDPDILKCLKTGQTTSDRPDIVARVFELKKNYLLNLILNEGIFGNVIGFCWVIEYQKRGLPHLHLLLTLDQNSKWHTTTEIDKFISAFIPEKNGDPDLHEIVSNCMMHGPCNEKSLCWNPTKNKCMKKFPKPFLNETKINEDGYPYYKRPNDGKFIYKKGIKLTNQYVVPYNPFLSKTFKAHINVERVADISAVKYIYDYIYKGYDAAVIECTAINENGIKKILNYDEVGKYLEARYLSPCEACWRIFKFPMQGKSHSVDLLDVHLENEQKIFYKKNATEGEIEEASQKETTLTAYFKFCQKFPELKFKYVEMPKYCTWIKKERIWKYPREGSVKKIGRLVPVNPTDTQKYYLRFLLLNVYGKSFADLRTVNEVEYDTFAKACLARGLIRDDEEWHKCMEEACIFSRKYPRGLRILFANILIHCSPKYPEKLWETFKEHLISDLKLKNPNQKKELLYQIGLKLINQLLINQEHCLSEFKTMPQILDLNVQIEENDCFDPKEELKTAENLKKNLNKEQKNIIEELTNVFEKNEQKCIYIDGPGGTGKSFTLKTIYHFAIGNGKKVCNMAFSGIAATILKKGRTLHNRFKLPLNVNKNSTSGVEFNSTEAEEIKEIDIFIWDEAPMASRFILDIIDRKLKELMQNNLPFGGKTFILSGDFRQCLPIKEFATRSEIVDLLIKNSPLWNLFKKIKLSQNMRANPNEKEFAEDLIKIGNGTIGENDYFTTPNHCICNENLTDEIFGNILKNSNYDKLSECAILSPYNSVVDKYNEEILNLLPGDCQIYLSIDETDPFKNNPVTPEILNSLKCSSIPNHEIKLKKGAMIMLLRNLNVKEGLCNGTRLQIVDLGKHVINCVIKSGDRIGEQTLIPRITLIEDKKFPFVLHRHQFPIKLAFAFTINKSQSQTFSKIGLDYHDEPFSHGQTYVALSRAKSWKDIKIKLSNENKRNLVKNIVWKETLK